MSASETESELGSASVLMVGVAGVLLVLTVGLVVVGVVLRTRAEVSAAADAAALAAAPITFYPFGTEATPAQEAARFAAINGAHLVSCSCAMDESWESRTVEVVVEKRLLFRPFFDLSIRASSRAEFVPALLLQPEAG